MASILDINSGSSDSEDDCDYVPPNAGMSDESDDEISDDEHEFSEAPPAKKTKLDKKEVEVKSSQPVVKKSTDEIWKSFLEDVETTPYGKQNQAVSSNLKTEPQNISSESERPSGEIKTKEEKAVADKSDEEKGTVTENAVSEVEKETLSQTVGEKVVVAKGTDIPLLKRSVEKNETNGVTKREPLNVKICPSRAGITSILGAIANKEKKMTVLEKSLHDWKSFKEEEGIDKDLETFNKGRQGFIERQRFLQRSDLRTFETEKSARLSAKKK